jgi:enoyl-CoA hydratase/carnithine racemase
MTNKLILKKYINPHIVEISLNRPEKLNALTKPMWQKLGQVFKKLSKDKNLRCIIIRGKGGKSFSPGNDISEFEKQRSSSKLAKAYGVHLHGTLRTIQECPIPTIALIEGICVGGGLEIAACCDIRICGETSRFGVPITTYSIAMEILLEGQIMNAKVAYEKNLVNRVVPDTEVENETYRSAELICEGAPMVARWHKKFAKEILKTGKVSNKLNNLGYKCYDTEDFKIGYKSFLTKTKPKFKNK